MVAEEPGALNKAGRVSPSGAEAHSHFAELMLGLKPPPPSEIRLTQIRLCGAVEAPIDVVALLQNRNSGDALLPLGWACVVNACALSIDRDGDRHVTHIELEDGFHDEVFKRNKARAHDGL